MGRETSPVKDPLSSSFDNHYAKQATEIVNFMNQDKKNAAIDMQLARLHGKISAEINPYDAIEGNPIGDLRTNQPVSTINIFPSDHEVAEENRRYEEHQPNYPYEGY